MGGAINTVTIIKNSIGTNVLNVQKPQGPFNNLNGCPIGDEISELYRRAKYVDAPVVSDFRKFCRSMVKGDSQQAVVEGSKLAVAAVPGIGSTSQVAKTGAQISKKRIIETTIASTASSLLNNFVTKTQIQGSVPKIDKEKMEWIDEVEKDDEEKKEDEEKKIADAEEKKMKKIDDSIEDMKKQKFGPKFADFLKNVEDDKARKMAMQINVDNKDNPSEKPNKKWCGEQGNYCLEQPRTYSYYDRCHIEWGICDDYEIMGKLGRGKYSEVFHGIDTTVEDKSQNNKVVIKCLKAVRNEKLNREYKVLLALKGGPNIVNFKEFVRENEFNRPSYIFEYMADSEMIVYRMEDHVLSDFDCRLYTYKIFEALEYCHSRGIIHRDIKPLNIIINHKRRKLQVIDWGLAEFYIPNQTYKVRVASRCYKGPELLVNDKLYHYSLDIWSLGCTFGEMIFKDDILFHGKDNHDQLIRIMKILGLKDLNKMLKRYQLKLPKMVVKMMIDEEFQKVPFSIYVKEENTDTVHPQALDLVTRMLVYDKNKRIKVKEAMEHPYFDPIRDCIKNQAIWSVKKQQKEFEKAKVEIEQSADKTESKSIKRIKKELEYWKEINRLAKLKKKEQKGESGDGDTDVDSKENKQES